MTTVLEEMRAAREDMEKVDEAISLLAEQPSMRDLLQDMIEEMKLMRQEIARLEWSKTTTSMPYTTSGTTWTITN